MDRYNNHPREILGIDSLQETQNAFARMTRTTVVLLDAKGKMSTFPFADYDFLGIFTGEKKLKPEWAERIQAVFSREIRPDETIYLDVGRDGLSVALVPIHFRHAFLGAWLIGYVRMNEGEDEAMEQTVQMPSPSTVATRAAFEQMSSLIASLNILLGQMYFSKVQTSQFAIDLEKNMASLEQSTNLLRTFIDSSDASMYLCDYHTGELLMVNRRYCENINRSMDEVLGQKCWKVNGVSDDGFCPICPREKLLDAKGNILPPYTWQFHHREQNRWIQCTNQVIEWEEGRLAQMVTLYEITDEIRMREQLAHLAYYNRNSLLQNGEKLVADLNDTLPGAGPNNQFLICYQVTSIVDFNSLYGRDAGNELFQVIARWISAELQGRCSVYHIESNRFCVRLCDCDLDEAVGVANAIRSRFSDAVWTIPIAEEEITCFVSAVFSVVGVYDSVIHGDVVDLIHRTLATAAKTNMIYVYDRTKDLEMQSLIQFEFTLKSAVKNQMHGFEVHYQPIVEVESGVWKGLEALCRWKNDRGENVSPAVFIPEVEKLGLICILGEWVLESSLAMCKSLGLDKLDGFYLSVNVSPTQVIEDGFTEKVFALLRKYDYPGQKLNLELTESTALTFNEHTVSVITELRSHDVRTALDDFGSGYSQFNALKNLPVSYLKTEKDFIVGIEQDTYLQYYFYIMSEIAHANNMKLIAEGIETQEQLDIIKNNGADYIQGYYFSKPLTRQALEAHLEKFKQNDESFVSSGKEPLDIDKWLHSREAYTVTPHLFLLLNQCMQLLLSEDDIAHSFPAVLQVVGRHFGVKRACAGVLDAKDGCLRGFYEWQPEGVAPYAETIPEAEREGFISDVTAALQKQSIIVASSTRNTLSDLGKRLYRNNIRSMLVLPLMDKARAVQCGWIGFDDIREREWIPEEIIMLWNLSMMMQSSILNDSLRSAVDQKQEALFRVLESTGMPVIISNLATHDVLWTNSSFQKHFLTESIAQKTKCHELLCASEETCANCPSGTLSAPHEAAPISFEYYDPSFDKTFIIYTSILEWENENAIIEYMLDISDFARTKNQLNHLLSMDPLTDTLNKNALISALESKLIAADQADAPLSIAFVDVDNMKGINQAYGLSKGNDLLRCVVDSLRKSIRAYDSIGRVGGDKFVVVFENCRAKVAHARMLKAQVLLSKSIVTPDKGTVTFSYGIAENSDRPGKTSASALVDLCAERMRTRQRAAGVDSGVLGD